MSSQDPITGPVSQTMIDNLVGSMLTLEESIESILSRLKSCKEEATVTNSPNIMVDLIKQGDDEYELSFWAEGEGISERELQTTLSAIGQSKNDGDDFWLISPFYLSSNSYVIKSRPDISSGGFIAESTPAGFEIIDEDGPALDKTGIHIRLTVNTDDHTIPEIGECIRSVSSDDIDQPVLYRVREGSTFKDEMTL